MLNMTSEIFPNMTHRGLFPKLHVRYVFQDPTTFCETISICKVPGYDTKAHYLVELTHAKPAEKETVSSGLLCTSCKLVMQEVDNLLEKKETIVSCHGLFP